MNSTPNFHGVKSDEVTVPSLLPCLTRSEFDVDLKLQNSIEAYQSQLGGKIMPRVVTKFPLLFFRVLGAGANRVEMEALTITHRR